MKIKEIKMIDNTPRLGAGGGSNRAITFLEAVGLRDAEPGRSWYAKNIFKFSTCGTLEENF